jgi:hypothetical protein
MMTIINPKSTGKWLFIAGGLSILTIIAWIVLMALNVYEGDIEDQLNQLKNNTILYSLSFINASLISIFISLIFIVLAFFFRMNNQIHMSDIASIVFLIPYIALSSISYVSQYTILLQWISSGGEHYSYAILWYFNNPDSLAIFINSLGYAIFSIAALFLCFKLIKNRGLDALTGLFLLLSAVTTLIGFAGYGLDNQLLLTGIVIGGFFIFPFNICIIIRGYKLMKVRD